MSGGSSNLKGPGGSNLSRHSIYALRNSLFFSLLPSSRHYESRTLIGENWAQHKGYSPEDSDQQANNYSSWNTGWALDHEIPTSIGKDINWFPWTHVIVWSGPETFRVRSFFLKMFSLAKSPAILKVRRISLPSPSSPSPSNHLHILELWTLFTSALEDEYMFISGKWNDCV